MYCLPKDFALKMKRAIANRTLNPSVMTNMSSQERRAFLSKIVGDEHAKEVNLLFEQKLLLKNQQLGIANWAREITGISKEQKEATLQKIRDTYAEKRRRQFSPKEDEAFLDELVADVYSKKTRTEVTLEEAHTITQLSKDLKDADRALEQNNTKDNAIKYGAARRARENYIGGLKSEAAKARFINPFKADHKEKAIVENAKIAGGFIADNMRTLKASFDNSFWGRQGLRVLLNPKYSTIWLKNFAKSFVDITQVLEGGSVKGDAIKDAVIGEVYSRENSRNGRYELGHKLDITAGEEEILSSLPSRIPALGRLFKASEVAYEVGAIRMRIDVADKLYSLAEKGGRDLTEEKLVGDINKLVNSMTGRGYLGKLEKSAPLLNRLFFSIKKAKADVDFLTDPFKVSKDPFVRKEAAKHLLSVMATITTIKAIAGALNPDDDEWNPLSADISKVKDGDTRFDVSGGMGWAINLSARMAAALARQKAYKSSVTGIKKELGKSFGSKDIMDVMWDVTENKFSPAAASIRDVLRDETFNGDDLTLLKFIIDATVPIIITEGIDTYSNERSAGIMAVLIAEAIGISANTYSIGSNWDSGSKKMDDFKERVGKKKFREANKEANNQLAEWFDKERKKPSFKKKSDEEKQNTITKKKANIKKQILYDYR